MRKVFKGLGILLGIVILLIVLTLAWVKWTDLPTYEVKAPQIQISMDSLAIARGEQITQSICAICHRAEDGKLSGKLFSRPIDGLGEIWAGNLTRHAETGTGRYTDGELVYLLRTGIKRDGAFAGPFMLFPRMSDADMAAVIAYLRSDAPAVEPTNVTHTNHLSLLGKALFKFGAMKPLPYEGKPLVAPATSDKIAYGRYLATTLYECSSCHSADFMSNNLFKPEESVGFFGGGNHIKDDNFNTTPSANITPHPTSGLGKWSEAQFQQAVRAGRRPDNSVLSHSMPRFVQLSEAEISAIWAYLQTVPALENQVLRAEQ